LLLRVLYDHLKLLKALVRIELCSVCRPQLLLPFEVSFSQGIHSDVGLGYSFLKVFESLSLQFDQHCDFLRQITNFLLKFAFDSSGHLLNYVGSKSTQRVDTFIKTSVNFSL
jgi:hypothetical protein